MPARKSSEPIGFAISIDTLSSERGVRIVATPIDGRKRLVARQAHLVCTIWLEGAATVRGKIAHTSGVVAYFQGTDALIELANTLSLRAEAVPDP